MASFSCPCALLCLVFPPLPPSLTGGPGGDHPISPRILLRNGAPVVIGNTGVASYFCVSNSTGGPCDASNQFYVTTQGGQSFLFVRTFNQVGLHKLQDK